MKLKKTTKLFFYKKKTNLKQWNCEKKNINAQKTKDVGSY